MTDRKKEILKGIVFAAIGCIIFYFHFIKWVPFPNFMNDAFKYAVDLVWAYIGGFMGILFLAPLLKVLIDEFHIVENLFY